MTKKSIAIIPVFAVLTSALMFFSITGLADGTAKAGSNEDPFASKSYVDKKFNELLEANGGKQFGFDEEPTAKSQETTVKVVFEPVLINAGQTVMGLEGTEIILRSGEAYAVISGENGLSDITDGRDILGGEKIPENHMLIIPRADGRGLEAVTDVWVLVKGGVEVK